MRELTTKQTIHTLLYNFMEKSTISWRRAQFIFNPSTQKNAWFLHLLKEIVEDMDTAFDGLFDEEQEYPFAYFVVCLGFLMILVIEQVVLSCTEFQNQPRVEVDNPCCNCENTIHSGLPVHLLDDNVQMRSYPAFEDSQDEVTEVMKSGILHAFAVALALSVHSVFEGLAFGLQDSIDDILQVFMAITIHKVVIAFSLGINFINSQVPWKTAALLSAIFCLASPVGGGIGVSLAASDGESLEVTLLNAILSGLATGTFLYVAFIELISYELTNIERQYVSQRLLLTLSISIGFSIFAGLLFI